MPGRFNLEDYEPVEERLKRFWNAHPQGRIMTCLVSHDEKRVVVRAMLYRDAEERPASTGYAEEIVGSTPVNRTSAMENCETSAIGRALANMNFASRGRASREEMEKVNRANNSAQANPGPAAERSRTYLLQIVRENRLDVNDVMREFEDRNGGTSLNDCNDVAKINEFGKWLKENLDGFRTEGDADE